VALLPNEAAARPPAAIVEQAFSPRVSGIGMHPWSESSYTANTAIVWNHPARSSCCNKALRGFDCE
jgi:hypothetical protein